MTLKDYSANTGRPKTTVYLAARRMFPERFCKGKCAEFTKQELKCIEKFLPENQGKKKVDTTEIPDSFWPEHIPDCLKEEGE